ncbi:hypothetical protein B0I37DRAFT_358329 [Chaetomium sp. MPI-CAGE-AT-0009]|nr:hypothetical protein B0I37DRAFT_358329 [Chaetomium sp. MPI-CAGE-AT-0009]
MGSVDDEWYYGGAFGVKCATPGLTSDLGPFLDPGLAPYGHSIETESQPTVNPHDTIIREGPNTTVGLTNEMDQHQSPTLRYATEHLGGNTETYLAGLEAIPSVEDHTQAMMDASSPNIWALSETPCPSTPSFAPDYGPDTVRYETQTASAHIENQVTPNH